MKTKPSKLTREQVFERLQEMDRLSSKLEGDITVTDVRERLHCGENRARKHLDEMVSKKELVQIELADLKGKPMLVWRIP
jgi:predicted ArsR family transcriptional regulator